MCRYTPVRHVNCNTAYLAFYTTAGHCLGHCMHIGLLCVAGDSKRVSNARMHCKEHGLMLETATQLRRKGDTHVNTGIGSILRCVPAGMHGAVRMPCSGQHHVDTEMSAVRMMTKTVPRVTVMNNHSIYQPSFFGPPVKRGHSEYPYSC